jgi:hypothetical protein
MQSSVIPDQPPLARGATWTLVGGLAVFAAILWTVYAYVFPRLGQEPVSATATLEFRESSPEPRDAWSRITLPDGTTRFVSENVTLTACDFQAFRNRHSSETPEMTLILSASGRSHLQKFQLQPTFSTFVVRLHGEALTEVLPEQWADPEVTLLLRGISHEEANVILARLTE